MNVIKLIINTLTGEEKIAFVNQLKKKNTRSDTKNIDLFKLMCKEVFPKNPEILLYGKTSKGAYHALCKRLKDSLVDFVAQKNFENESSEEFEILKLLLAARVFFEQKHYQIAFKTLAKAEVKAINFDLYSILNEVYYTKIQYAHEDSKIDITITIQNFKKNKQLLEQEEHLNLFYATVKNEIKNTNITIETIISDNLAKFDISISEDLNYKSLFQLLEILTSAANQSRNYKETLPFIVSIYKEISASERILNKQLFYHIQVLYYTSNAYFRNRNFEASQAYLDIMLEQMKLQKSTYYNRFYPQYTLLNTLLLNYSGKSEKAIQTLKSFNYKKHKDQLVYTLDLQLAHIVYLFQQSEFKAALSLLNLLHRNDSWYVEKNSLIWVVKKNLIEIMLHIEFDNFDLVASRLKSFQKKHATILKEKNELLVLDFIKYITENYFNPEKTKSKKQLTQFNKITNSVTLENKDIFMLSFYAWLKARLDSTDVYKTTLRIVNPN